MTTTQAIEPAAMAILPQDEPAADLPWAVDDSGEAAPPARSNGRPAPRMAAAAKPGLRAEPLHWGLVALTALIAFSTVSGSHAGQPGKTIEIAPIAGGR